MIYESRSLKDKRRVLQGLKTKLQDRFNASVAEVDHLDAHQRCTLGIAIVSNESRTIHARFDLMMDILRANGRLSLLSYEREFL